MMVNRPLNYTADGN